MIFTELRLRNVLSFADEQVIDLTGSGLTLIEGVNLDDESVRSNGSGKSGCIDGFYWVLYGVTTHYPSAEGDEVIWRYGDRKNCLGQVTFYKGETKYEVRRGRACVKEAKKLLGRTTGLALYKDDVVVTLGTTKATQALLNTVLGMNASTFRHCVIFGQSKAYRFAQLTDKEKKAVLDDMLGVEVYTAATKLARQYEQEAERKVERLQADIKSLELRQADVTRRCADFRDLRGTEQADHEKDVLIATDALQMLSKKEAKARKKLNSLNMVTLAEVVNQATLSLEDLDDQIQKLGDATHQDAIATSNKSSQILSLARKLQKAEALGEGSCNTCGSAITEATKAAHVQEMTIEASVLSHEHNALECVSYKSERKLAATKSKRSKVNTELKKALEAKDLAKQKTLDLKYLTKEVVRAKQSLEALEVYVPRYNRMLKQGYAQDLHLRLQMSKLQEDLEDECVSLEAYTFWRKGFDAKGLRSLMIDSVLPYLNSRVEEYTNTITNGHIQVEFRTQKENKDGTMREEFHVYVDNAFGAGSYNMCSVGERAKIDLVVGLALQDMAVHKSQAQVNVAFFDEPFDGLDDVAMDRVVDLLSEVMKHRNSVYVITHSQSLKAFIPQSLTVTKQNQKSTVR